MGGPGRGVVGVWLGAALLLSPASGLARAGQEPGAGGPRQAVASVSERQLLKARLGQTFVSADFDRDGLADIAVVDFLTDALTLMFGTASGGFDRVAGLTVARGSRAIVAGDFDNDGVADLAVGSLLAGSVDILIGRGDGSFDRRQTLHIGSGLSSLAASDVDGDGRLDLAAANVMSGQVVVLKNGPGLSWMRDDVAQLPAPTLVLFQDTDGDGMAELVAIDADGRAFRAAAPSEQTAASALQVSPRGDDRAGRSWSGSPNPAARLRSVDGDGQVGRGGSSARESLVAQSLDPSGVPGAGELVSFTRLVGTAEFLPPGPDGTRTEVTDARGLARVDLRLPGLPDATIVVASQAPDGVSAFHVVTHLPAQDIARLIEARLASLPGMSQGVERTAWRAVLRDLARGDTRAAVARLIASIEQLERGVAPPGTSTADLARRILNQVLLLGTMPRVPDDEPIACDVPLTRTIATADEIDRFTFGAVAGERLHITLGNEGGLSGFNPVWRLLDANGLPAAGCDTSTTADRECVVAVAGTLTIEVQDGGSNSTGTYSVQIQPLTAADRCSANVSCDVAAVDTISARADTDLHQFDGTAGERLHITLGNEGGLSGFDPVWRLLDDTGSPVTGCGTYTTGDRECVLTTTGAHAVEVEDGGLNATGTYSLQFQRLTAAVRCGAAIACDIASVDTISARADTDLLQFSGVSGERLHITLANEGGLSGFDPVWRLLGPDAAAVAGCDTFTTVDRECVMPVDGAYAIEVEDGGLNSTGTYSLHIQRLTAALRCGTLIACDVASVNTISARADTDLHQFSGVSGERLHITLANEGGLSGFGPVWRLLGPDAAAVAGCDTFTTVDRECVMPVDGAYAIEVEDGGLNSTGTYSLHIQRLTAALRCGTIIACDVASANTISARADTDLHQFDGESGEIVHVTLGDEGGLSGFNPVWRLLGPDATPVPGCDAFAGGARDCQLPQAPGCDAILGCIPVVGPYAIEVEDGGFNSTGSYSLHIQRLSIRRRCAGALPCDVGATSTISARADTDLYSLDGFAGEQVHVTATLLGGLSGFNPEWRLVGPSGSGVVGCDTFSSAPRDCVLPAYGVYAVEVQDGGNNSTGTYSLTVTSSIRFCAPPAFVLNEPPPTRAMPAVERISGRPARGAAED